MTAAAVFLTIILVAIAVIDARTYRIPDMLSLSLLAGGLISNWTAENSLPVYLIGACLGYLILAGFGWTYFHLRGREGFGLGDAKLFAAGGAWLGWQWLPFVLLAASFGALLYAVLGLWTGARSKDDRIAWGPWLAASIWLIWMTITYV